MPRSPLSVALVFAVVLPGCGAPAVSLPPPPPHGGTAYTLPHGKGFVEVVRRDATDRAGRTELVVYFLNAERKTLPSAASNVSFAPKERNAAALKFQPIGVADSADAGGLASAPFDDSGEIVGLLSATIDGETVAISVNLR
jgi:hypothetical protein